MDRSQLRTLANDASTPYNMYHNTETIALLLISLFEEVYNTLENNFENVFLDRQDTVFIISINNFIGTTPTIFSI